MNFSKFLYECCIMLLIICVKRLYLSLSYETPDAFILYGCFLRFSRAWTDKKRQFLAMFKSHGMLVALRRQSSAVSWFHTSNCAGVMLASVMFACGSPSFVTISLWPIKPVNEVYDARCV